MRFFVAFRGGGGIAAAFGLLALEEFAIATGHGMLRIFLSVYPILIATTRRKVKKNSGLVLIVISNWFLRTDSDTNIIE